MLLDFPSPENADEEGLVGIGGDFSVENLINAYHKGIFPWPINQTYPYAWFSPNPRGIFQLDEFRIPRSLKKFINKELYTIKYNTQFEAVIRQCAIVKRKDQSSTWITEELIQGYISLFNEGLAYSVEVYHEENLIGGLYGVCMGSIISGESMFHLKDHASKIALVNLVNKLKKASIKILDTQMVTPVTQSLGAKEISRSDFLKMIEIKKPLHREAIFN